MKMFEISKIFEASEDAVALLRSHNERKIIAFGESAKQLAELNTQGSHMAVEVNSALNSAGYSVFECASHDAWLGHVIDHYILIMEL